MTMENLSGGELDLQKELEDTIRALREITLMMEQSQGELSKLSQRNAAITTHLQQVQGQMASMPPQEIRNVYDSALDAQQRLFVMRGQLEKLQAEKTHLERIKTILEKAPVSSGSGGASSGPTTGGSEGTMASVEMRVNAQDPERPRL